MTREELLSSYIPLADFIAKMNGGHCEVLIHDVRDLEHSIIYVTQPSITGRHRGNGMTDYALQLVRSGRFLTEPFVVNYVGGTQERVLRSSTYFIKDQGELAGLLCVNIEVDHLLQGIDILRQALILDPAKLQRQETFHPGSTIEERMEAIFQRFLSGREPEQLSVKEKRQLVYELRRDGVFDYKGKVSQVSQLLHVSEKTVYRYLKVES